MRIVLNKCLKLIPDLQKEFNPLGSGVGDEGVVQFLNESTAHRQVFLIRSTFMKLLNDEEFYTLAKNNGLLEKFVDWSAKGCKKSHSFLQTQTIWTRAQWIAFWVIAGSSDQFDQRLENAGKSLQELIGETMGFGNVVIGKLDLEKLNQVGLKRKIVDITAHDENIIDGIYDEIVKRGEKLIESLSNENVHIINYRKVWGNNFILPDKDKPFTLGKRLQIDSMIRHATYLTAPLQRQLTSRVSDETDELITKALRTLEEIEKNKGLLRYLRTQSSLQIQGELRAGQDALNSVIEILRKTVE